MNWTENSLILDEVVSTNSYLLELARRERDLPQLYSVVARHQTAGRGQRGNTWSVSPGDSLTFSFLLRSTGLVANRQYAVSEFTAYSVFSTLREQLPEGDKQRLSIKWPNDIYIDDRKIAGILIEHSITGKHIDFSVVGIGINVNETAFPSSLPNPISLRQITGRTYKLSELHRGLMQSFAEWLEPLLMGHHNELHERCMSHLYRRRGLHRYRDARGAFLAEVRDVLPSGELVLLSEEGEERVYAFKEVTNLI